MEYSWANVRQERKDTGISLAKECYSMKLDLLTNATVVDDAIRFVSQKLKVKLKPYYSNSNEDDKESSEPDYDEDEGQLEEKKQAEAIGEITTAKITTNQVF
jgi:hypothetical protein